MKYDARYQDHGLKGLGIDVKQSSSMVLGKSNSHAMNVKVVY